MRRIVKFIPAVIALYMAGCDDGRVYDETGGQIPESGFTARVEGDIAGCDDYQDDSKYSVAFAAFKEGDSFAAVIPRQQTVIHIVVPIWRGFVTCGSYG